MRAIVGIWVCLVALSLALDTHIHDVTSDSLVHGLGAEDGPVEMVGRAKISVASVPKSPVVHEKEMELGDIMVSLHC